ncbi:hypothetical protein GCM10011613_20910 [Cellvibrio zantedeschiae]|uniref:YigZ family protein n=1 Tax=Cellvibrio zantedeschiae TaxID=1237077 RepID=A0ABQ3B2N4_9GAMM|nr:YigZ family protein [Cellvibrio zantedeschiae]GGY75221.1 hypothetical protein GCM10011613_20910 [Cellvibrio zantedeschiae]
MSSYTILTAAIESTTVEKNSDFITFLHPISSREEAMTHVDYYRKKYPDANHVCWAYIIGNTRQPLTQAFSDDGEPSGTAGKPMLHILTEREVGNSLAVVVRYFGGVKLGAGGLIRAYSGAVSSAVNCAQLTLVTPCIEIKISVDFAKEAKIRHLVELHKGKILATDYDLDVAVTLSLAVAQAESFIQDVINETAGHAIVHKTK